MNGSERITKTECLIENSIPKYSRKKLTLLVQFTVDYLYLFDSTIAIKTVTYANKIEKNLVVDVMSTRFENNTCVENLKLNNVSIHEAIMDQTLMPGVGNVIKCEGLFNASIHPNSLACNIPHDKLCELVNELKVFAWRWYEDTVHRRHTRYNVYGKEACIACNKNVSLVRSGKMQRITYFCNNCQINFNHPNFIVDKTHTYIDAYNTEQLKNKSSSGNIEDEVELNYHSSNDYLSNQVDSELNRWCCEFCGYCNAKIIENKMQQQKISLNCEICDEKYVPKNTTFFNNKILKRFENNELICNNEHEHNIDFNHNYNKKSNTNLTLNSNDADNQQIIFFSTNKNKTKFLNNSETFISTTTTINKHNNLNNNNNNNTSNINNQANNNNNNNNNDYNNNNNNNNDNNNNNNENNLKDFKYFLNQMKCHCKLATKLQRVRKSGVNLNRLFWACPNKIDNNNNENNENNKNNGMKLKQKKHTIIPSKVKKTKNCNFFYWADTMFPRCEKHDLVTILRRVLKENENNGKFFFCCSQQEKNLQCSFFQWIDTFDEKFSNNKNNNNDDNHNNNNNRNNYQNSLSKFYFKNPTQNFTIPL
jgi:hypothetical protein